jgi:hypothetical protein
LKSAHILACHLQIDADPVANHFDVDPDADADADPDFYFMRMWMRIQVRK